MSSIFLKIILLQWSETCACKRNPKTNLSDFHRNPCEYVSKFNFSTWRRTVSKTSNANKNLILIRQIICISWPSVKIAFVTLCSPWTITNIYGSFEILNTPIAQCKRNLYCNSPCKCPWVTVTVLNGRTSHAIPEGDNLTNRIILRKGRSLHLQHANKIIRQYITPGTCLVAFDTNAHVQRAGTSVIIP